MFNTFKLGINTMWTKKFQMYKLDLEKAEEPEIKLPTYVDHRKSKGTPKKTSASLTMQKSLIVYITIVCRKFLKKQEYQTTLPVPWETCM